MTSEQKYDLAKSFYFLLFIFYFLPLTFAQNFRNLLVYLIDTYAKRW